MMNKVEDDIITLHQWVLDDETYYCETCGYIIPCFGEGIAEDYLIEAIEESFMEKGERIIENMNGIMAIILVITSVLAVISTFLRIIKGGF